ncbi:3-hydroxybenzoate 6-hydroxylase [Acidothermaceae bacterium B102]|nr:3-hydroxybenzoate 6-hydroxylase [Acidothermaceae bacterium B102]
MTSTTFDDVVIVGGGIGGLTTALSLVRSGRSVRVLERASAFAEVGAGIQLAPNATRTLDQLGLLDEVISVGVLPRRIVMADAVGGGELTWLDLTDFPKRYGGPYIVLHRSDLLDILLRAGIEAGVGLETNAHVETVADEGGRVVAVCSDGRAFAGSVLIGADGLRSTLRPMFVEDDVICSGYVAYRGAVPIEQVERHADLRDVVAWLGPGMHLVQYPLRSGDLYNQVAVFRSPSFERGDPDWGNPAELEERFSVCCEHVRESVPMLGRDHRWPMYDRLPTTSWTAGRVALMGDAAHPMLQYLAQGACQAMEDAMALTRALAGRDLTVAHVVADGLAGYRDERTPRTARVQTSARAWGEIWHVDGVAKLLRDELFRDRALDDRRHVDWLYDDAVAPPPA